MIIIKKAGRLREYLQFKKKAGIKLGFVPTMGALHAGHLALIQEAKKQTGLVVCSIFVNPTQFNEAKDYQKYPITIEKDIDLLERDGVDIFFLPSINEIFPDGISGLEQYDLGYLDTILEAKYRPGHFQGVCQVMKRLLFLVQPDKLFMGQKDYQQCMVIKRLIQLINNPVQLVTCPTVREADGLALSSRNLRLNEEQRKKAVSIYRSLLYISDHLKPGDQSEVLNNALFILTQNDFIIDYIIIADANTLEPVNDWNGKKDLVALIAAFQSDVRLIDNMVVTK